MPGTSHHVIRRQYLHVELNGTEADGFALQTRLPALYQDALVPAIERVLDRCGPVDGYLYIDLLEIDAGETTLERLEFALAESVSQAIEKALRSTRTMVAGNVRLKSTGHSITESFIYFLETGTLPWSFRLPQGESLEQAMLDVLRDPVKAGIDERSTAEGIRRALVSEVVRNRLTLQFSRVFLEALLLMLAPELKAVLERVLRSVSVVDESIAGRKHFERKLLETVIGGAAESKSLTPELLVRETLRSLPESFFMAPVLAEVLERHWPDALFKDRIDAVPKKSATEAPPGLILPRFAKTKNSPMKLNEHPEAKEGIYVRNAGVVLLHPFLPQLFSAIGIASEDRLLQPARAIGLLHFLTTGELQVPEYELVLPKILCEFPLDVSVESNLDLTTTEKDEATAVLQAVIRHWSALGDTSPDALRGTFLLRPGKVSLRDDGDWLLQVESKGFDILLEQLPWGFSTIKLPWMKSMLWVEWSGVK